MKKLLLVIDMQNDFIDGALGTAEAESIVPAVVKKAEEFDGDVIFTRDTHFDNYMETQEGKKLPVPHCIQGTHGWELHPELERLRLQKNAPVFDKLAFGCRELPDWLAAHYPEGLESIELVGVCTDRHLRRVQRSASESVFPGAAHPRHSLRLRRRYAGKP